MTKNIINLMALASLTLFMAACSSDDDNGKNDDLTPIKIECSTVQQTDYAAKSNKFAAKFYSALASLDGSEGKNICLSPISMQYLVSMLANGASDDAIKEVADAFEFGSLDNMNTNSKDLLERLSEDDDYVQVALNNGIWAQKEYAYLPDFKTAMETYYRATLGSADFKNNPEGAQKTLDKWASDNTGGLIKKMPIGVTTDTRLILANALYFNGKWSSPFNADDTAKETFYNLNGRQYSTDMMMQESYYRGYADDSLQAVEMTYGKGYYTMMIVMPTDSKRLDEIAASIDWWQLHNKMEGGNILLKLPKFKTTSSWKDLQKVFPQMGLGRLASSVFARMVIQPNIVLSKVAQDVTIEVEENGTKAAAVSEGEQMDGAAYLPTIITFDHPFVYVIRENTTGTIMFMGRVVNF